MTAVHTAIPDQKPPGRIFLVIGFLATTAVTTAGSVLSGYYLNAWQVTRAQKISDVNKFVDATEAFNPLVREYTSEILAGKPADDTKEKIGKNIQLQDTLLEDLSPYLDEEGKKDVLLYRKLAVDVDAKLSAAHSLVESRDFYQAVADSLPTRSVVVGDLRRSAGLPGATKKPKA